MLRSVTDSPAMATTFLAFANAPLWATPLQPQPVRSAVWRGWALALALLCVLLLALPARAQNANDGFDPTANGEVRAIAVQPDGKVLVGGSSPLWAGRRATASHG